MFNSQPPDSAVIYIAGYGRSGSTILDMVFDQQSDIFGAGELTHVFADWRRNRPCSCGVMLQQCPFWTRVLRRWSEAGIRVDEAETDTREVENSRLRQVRRLRRNPERSVYAEAWRSMFSAVEEIAQVSLIVDSSKTTGTTALRRRSLQRVLDRNVDVVHLVRDPRAVLYSISQGRGPSEGTPRRHPQLVTLRSSLAWSLSNRAAAADRKQAPHTSVVRYEDLLRDTPSELSRLIEDLGLGTPDRSVRVPPRLSPGHGIRGNRLRRSAAVELRIDDLWRRVDLNWVHRLASALTWPVAIHYGYNPLSKRGPDPV